MLKYIVKGPKDVEEVFGKVEEPSDDQKSVMMLLKAVEEAKVAIDETELTLLIEEHNLVREHIPTNYLKSTAVSN